MEKHCVCRDQWVVISFERIDSIATKNNSYNGEEAEH